MRRLRIERAPPWHHHQHLQHRQHRQPVDIVAEQHASGDRALSFLRESWPSSRHDVSADAKWWRRRRRRRRKLLECRRELVACCERLTSRSAPFAFSASFACAFRNFRTAALLRRQSDRSCCRRRSALRGLLVGRQQRGDRLKRS